MPLAAQRTSQDNHIVARIGPPRPATNRGATAPANKAHPPIDTGVPPWYGLGYRPGGYRPEPHLVDTKMPSYAAILSLLTHLSVAEAAARLGVSEKWVDTLSRTDAAQFVLRAPK